MQIADGTGSGRIAGVDDLNRLQTSSLSIPLVHHELHKGELFTCHYENTVTNIDEKTAIAFNTPKDIDLILGIRVEVTGTATAYLYEDTSIDVGEGTVLTIFNRNRSKKSSPSSVSTIETTPVTGSATSFNETQAADANITTTTDLWVRQIGSDLKLAFETSGSKSVNEWLLDRDQQYAVVINSTTADDNVCNITLSWQEEIGHGHLH